MSKKLRLAILHFGLTEYAYQCWAALAARADVELWGGTLGWAMLGAKVFQENVTDRTRSFDVRKFDAGAVDQIVAEIGAFGPEIYIGHGWKPKAPMTVAKRLKKKRIRTVCCADTPWLGTVRQSVRCILGGPLVRSAYEAIFIPGARGIPPARLMGFPDTRIWQNLYCGNSDLFSRGTRERLGTAHEDGHWPQRFIFVGRLVDVKNVRGLLAAYKIYRTMAKDPWPLSIVGDGPLINEVRNQPGVECLGWLKAEEISRQMACSGVFILPSFYEPWGVVVHEAACRGLPLMLSLDVAASSDLLRDGYNGRIFDAKDPTQIAQMMRWFSEHPRLWEFGQRSFEISHQFSPALWADHVVTRSHELLQS
jgi:glycosyltransferase involved in cell wall biosynthesis